MDFQENPCSTCAHCCRSCHCWQSHRSHRVTPSAIPKILRPCLWRSHYGSHVLLHATHLDKRPLSSPRKEQRGELEQLLEKDTRSKRSTPSRCGLHCLWKPFHTELHHKLHQVLATSIRVQNSTPHRTATSSLSFAPLQRAARVLTDPPPAGEPQSTAMPDCEGRAPFSAAISASLSDTSKTRKRMEKD